MCNVLCRILENEGYEVVTANDGEAAMQLTQENRPALILLDLMMPGSNKWTDFGSLRVSDMMTASIIESDDSKARRYHRDKHFWRCKNYE